MTKLLQDDVCALLDDLAPHGNGLLVMLKAYFDLGAKSDKSDAVMTVAAVVFDPKGYQSFVEPWNLMLFDWPAPWFHATDFYPGYEAFWRFRPDGTIDPVRQERHNRHSRIIPHMIGQNAAYLLAVGFRPREYLEVASPDFRKNYGLSLHSMATQIVLVLLGWWAKERNYSDGFACLMESGDDTQGEVETTVRNMRHDPVIGPHIQISSFTTIEKGRARGLEAADCLAWHWNKYYMDKVRIGKSDEMRIDLAALAVLSEGRHYFDLVTGDKLKSLLDVSPENSPSFRDEFSALEQTAPFEGQT